MEARTWQIPLNAYLIREKVLKNAYTSDVAEQLIAAECPYGAAALVAKTAEEKGLSIADALANMRNNGRVHPSLFAMPNSTLRCRNSWPPVPGGNGWPPVTA